MSDEIDSSKATIYGTWYPNLGETAIPIIMNTTMHIIVMITYFNTTP
jgi:hypothetical protein